MKITDLEFNRRLKWTLPQKVDHSLGVIDEFYSFFNGNVYVSFSGGKDSTVLLYLARKIFPDIPAVFIDTGLEFPEIRNFVKTQKNIIWIKPRFTFKEVLDKYGYPVISKQESEYIEQYKNTTNEELKKLRLQGVYNPKYSTYSYSISKKWQYLIHAPFKISAKCCASLKIYPKRQFERKTGKHALLGTMAEESSLRKKQYLRSGCNVLEGKGIKSMPLAIWTTRDIWNFIKKENIPYSKIYDKGWERTGCAFCLFGIHLEGNPNRFQRMERTHPSLHKFCLNHLSMKEVLEYIKVPYNYTGEQQTLFKNHRND